MWGSRLVSWRRNLSRRTPDHDHHRGLLYVKSSLGVIGYRFIIYRQFNINRDVVLHHHHLRRYNKMLIVWQIPKRCPRWYAIVCRGMKNCCDLIFALLVATRSAIHIGIVPAVDTNINAQVSLYNTDGHNITWYCCEVGFNNIFMASLKYLRRLRIPNLLSEKSSRLISYRSFAILFSVTIIVWIGLPRYSDGSLE